MTLPARAIAPALVLACAWAGCGNSPQAISMAATAAPNPNSACSAIVTFAYPGASQARVIASDGVEKLRTPWQPLADGRGAIAMLGLAASHWYQLAVEVQHDAGTAVSDPIPFATGALPSDLETLHMAVTGPAPDGYYLVSTSGGNETYAVDGAGVVRWYRAFDQPTQESKMQPDGTFTTYVGSSSGWQSVDGAYVRYTPDGTQLGKYTAASPDDSEPGAPAVYTDNHELLVTRDASGEHLHLFGYEQRPASATDPTPSTWHTLLRQTPDGRVELRWKSWSIFDATDSLETIPLPGVHDIDHSNSIAIDPTDGNYVTSFRDTDAVVKIDYQTGAVLWQLGGQGNQFTFVNDPLGGFQGQHSLEVLPDGHLLLYDNGLQHSPPESRAVEYALDAQAKTATLIWQFRHAPAIFTNIVGSVERLASGNTLVAFAWAGVVDEVDASGHVVWEGQLDTVAMPAPAYRIRKLVSLYNYVQP